MPKRKKYPKLPNGYGSIKYLGKGRRNPYGVYPPVTDFTDDGIPVTPKAICYTDAWIKGFTVLTAYKAGTYYSGFEQTLNFEGGENDLPALEALAQKILADYNQIKGVTPPAPQPTLKEVYADFYTWKFERDKSRTYSSSTRYAIQSGYKNCAALHERELPSITYDELQSILDNSPLKHAGREHILNFLRQIFEYAMLREIIDKNPAAYLKINIPDDDEQGVPFSDSELRVLWKHQEDPVIEMLLIMCYSGYRITAYADMEVNLTEKYFRGGVKTANGKNRIVPIHSAILPLVRRRLSRDGKLLSKTTATFRDYMYDTLGDLKIEKHTPHDCRHTFSKLCEDYHVNENDRKRMLGHSFGNDITNTKYGHRDVEALRAEIEKIKICC